MNDTSCLSLIRSRLDTWSAKERRVASYILANPGEAVDPSIEELAEKIGVSESTLFRFVRKLGYGGYQQFRIALATEALSPRELWYETPGAGIDEKSAASVVFRTSVAALEATLAGLDPAILDKVAALAVAAPKILLLGLGGSNAVAQDSWHKLIRTGIPCEAPVDFHLQIMVASQSLPGTLVVLFSHTGANKDALAIADEAKRAQSDLVVVTSHPRSPLSHKADLLLISRTPSSPFITEAWSARLAQLALMDSLYIVIMEKLGDRGDRHLLAMREAIARRRL